MSFRKAASRTQSIKATFQRERHVFNNDDGSRIIIADAERSDGLPETLRGPAMEGELRPGLDYEFYGYHKQHPKFGMQFWFENFTQYKPVGKRAIVVFLSTTCSGIGSVIANRIYEEFADKSIEALRDTPEEVAEKVKGLTKEKALAAAGKLRSCDENIRLKAELMDLLAKRGFRRKTIDELILDYGHAAAAKIRNNPWLLLNYTGAGFAAVDQLFTDLGGSPWDRTRQMECGVDAIRRSPSGDTWVHKSEFISAINDKIAGADVDAQQALVDAITECRIRERGDWVADRGKADAEELAAHWVARLMHDKPAWDWPNIEDIDGISDHQREELSKSLASRIGILAGSPGGGKTWTAAALVKSILATGFRISDIAVATPTGKAAVRITQALTDAGVNLKAMTVHSMLLGARVNGSGWAFTKGNGETLPFKLILVDEASMLDCEIFSWLISAIPPHCHILFIGDPNQLPPVGNGSPLRDMIAAGVPCGTLTEIRRNAGRIVRACAEIRDNRRFVPSEKLDIENGENLAHIECDTPDQQVTFLYNLFNQIATTTNIHNKLKLESIDSKWDVQIIVPVNKNTPVSRQELNSSLQRILNPEMDEDKKFSAGDKVICLKNSDFSLIEIEDGQVKETRLQVRVANGEQGEVVAATPLQILSRITGTNDIVKVPVRKPDAKEGDGEESGDQGSGCNWDLAYAISCHRSQGDQWPIVVVMIDGAGSARQVCNVQWIYTAISRARHVCVTVGKKSDIDAMCRRSGLKRKTFLKELIGEKQLELRIQEQAELIQELAVLF